LYDYGQLGRELIAFKKNFVKDGIDASLKLSSLKQTKIFQSYM
jgi:hypothetical protein